MTKGERTALQNELPGNEQMHKLDRKSNPVLRSLWYLQIADLILWLFSTLCWTWPECLLVQKKLRFMLGIYTFPKIICFPWEGDLTTRGQVELLPGQDELVTPGCCWTEHPKAGWLNPGSPPWHTPRWENCTALWLFFPSRLLAQQTQVLLSFLEIWC